MEAANIYKHEQTKQYITWQAVKTPQQKAPRISKLGNYIYAKKLLSGAKPVTEAAVLLKKKKLYNNEKIPL